MVIIIPADTLPADILFIIPMQPHPWVDVMIDNVNEEIYQDKNQRADYYASHDHRIIPFYNPLHCEPADSVPAEDGLCKHSPV